MGGGIERRSQIFEGVNKPENWRQQHEKLGVIMFHGGATTSGKLRVHYGHMLLLVDNTPSGEGVGVRQDCSPLPSLRLSSAMPMRGAFPNSDLFQLYTSYVFSFDD